LVKARPDEEIAWRQVARGKGGAVAAGDEQLGSSAAEKMNIGKLILAAMYLRRV
jgi:hypothetical protein